MSGVVARVALGEIATIKGGKRVPKGLKLSEEPTGHPYIRARDIGGGKVTFDDPIFLTESVASKLARYTVKEGDVCLTIVGANVGDIGVVPSSLDGANLTENAVKIVANGKADQGFLKYALLTNDASAQMKVLAGGAAQPKLGIYKIETIEVPFPDLPTQRRIAGILSAYDDLIENNLRRIRILEEMAQSLYREWFVHFRFPGHESVPLVDSPLGSIPEGWEVRTLGELLSALESGKRPRGGIDPSESEIPSIGAENVRGIGQHDYSKEKFVSREFFEGMSKGRINDGDVLLYKDGAYIGRSTHLRNGFPHAECCVNEHVFILRGKPPELSQTFLYHWISQAETVDAIRSTNANAAQPGINQQSVKGLVILLPAMDLRSRFERYAEPIAAEIVALAKRNETLRRTRDLLLPKLLNPAPSDV